MKETARKDMVSPEVNAGLGSIDYLWVSWGIRVKVSRVTIEGSAELWFYNSKANKLLHISKVNLLATSTMATLAKRMDIHSSNLPWNDMLTYITARTMEISRQGEPVREAWAGDDVQPPRYILEPLIIENQPAIIFGDPGSMKSNLALIISQLVMLPWHDNPLQMTVPEHSCKTLYLDWETDYETIQWQLTTLRNGMGMEGLMIPYRKCSMPLAYDIDAIRSKIEDTDSKMIIIDSLALACGGELNKEQSAIAFFSALRQLNVSSLILAHNQKGNGDNTKSIYGSVFFTAFGRNVWEIRKSQEAGGDSADIALIHHKPAPFQRLSQPLGFHMDFGGNSVRISLGDPELVSGVSERMSYVNKLLDLLQKGRMQKEEIALEFPEMKDGTLRQTLKRLRDKHGVTLTLKGYGFEDDN